MHSSWIARLGRAAAALLTASCLLAACGGGGGGGSPDSPPPVVTPPPNPALEIGNSTAHATVLQAVPANADGGGGTSPGPDAATSLTIHYQRQAGDTAGWTLHTWGAAQGTEWTAGRTPVRSDTFGVVYDVPLAAGTGNVGYIFHKGDEKDHGGADQSYTLKGGANEIWRIQGDGATYTRNPSGLAAPDLATLRVHYKRYGSDYANWGLHLWAGSGLDTARMPAGVSIDQWNNAVRFDQMPGYAAGATEVVFDIPVLNPQGNPARKALEFIIHGRAPNENDKDGRPDNIRVDYASLKIVNQTAEVWIVQQDSTVYAGGAPDLRASSLSEARAVWLDRQMIQWPRVNAAGNVKLYWSATGQVKARLDEKVSGADGSITLDAATTFVPAPGGRFKWVAPGAIFAVRSADLPLLAELHKKQLVLVQEDAGGNVQNATLTQTAGALDEIYAAAAGLADLGVTIDGGNTRFKLWAPTAQKVSVFTYDSATGAATTVDEMTFDAATGAWSASRSGDLSGKYYRYAVEVFVRGVGLVRNLVTDPYSLSLSTDSARSYVAHLDSAALKPPGWDTSVPPAKVAAAPDMSIYELHVRDFSANDATVSAANRGKYLAFTEAGANGMKHLKALADAGLTDVHLLPVFDIASVPESGCSTPSPAGAADAEAQQAAVAASASTDCFNWGYDPWHYTAPEGSYASNAADGAKRIVEFRQMVKALHDADLRVGMDVVYNHTTASGQNTKSVLDRIVPGYYHRLNAAGAVENSTCCDNTATENLMMAKLMTDSVVTWARDYKISSFRFDIMGHQPRAVMEALKARVKAAAGRDVQLIGEGWNFGEVADGARFVQASMWSLNGSGIGSFNPFIRDAVRGGSPFDSGAALVANQGFINGLHYDANPLAGSRSRTDLMWQGDLIKAGLAGSIRSYALKTHWDETKPLETLNGAGYVTDPSEVVNYIENHDNQTLFDINALRLPAATSKEDRARVQILGAAINALSQGVAYFHAGVDTLRSKSGDRNSYDSGDWFNRLDWSYADNHFGIGLPPARDNGASWGTLRPFLADAALKPGAAEIAWTRDAFRDLLRIRASSTLLRLRTADDIKTRLRFHNTGSAQVETVLMGHVDGAGYAGAGFKELLYLVNVDKQARTVAADALKGKAFQLHPVHAVATAADARAKAASYDGATGSFTVPARTAVVFVVN
jgi:pullulanase